MSTYTVTVRSKRDNSIVRVKHFANVDYYEAMEYHKMVKTRYSKSFDVDFKIKMFKIKEKVA